MPGNLSGRTDGQMDGRTDGHAVKRLRLVGWTNGHMYRSKEAISGFGRTDGRTDGQPQNIMPPAPKGGGINNLGNWTIKRDLLNDPNENYNAFEKIILDAKDKFLSPKKVWFKKYRHKLSPWITNGILTSIKQRDKIHLSLIASCGNKEYNVIQDLAQLQIHAEKNHKAIQEEILCRAIWKK